MSSVFWEGSRAAGELLALLALGTKTGVVTMRAPKSGEEIQFVKYTWSAYIKGERVTLRLETPMEVLYCMRDLEMYSKHLLRRWEDALISKSVEQQERVSEGITTAEGITDVK